MHRMTERLGLSTCRVATALVVASLALSVVFGVSAVQAASPDQLWRDTIELAKSGKFIEAAKASQKLPGNDPLATRAKDWLASYRRLQEERTELDRAEFDMFVGYAQQRMERGEFDKALQQALRAGDVAEDRDALLSADWMKTLVDKSLAAAEAYRKKTDWRRAWDIYWRLAELYDREPKYRKLEREVLTHWRLDSMFDEDTWEEPLEKVRWTDAQRALEYIELYYVKNADFRAVAEAGLEQLLLLAESKSARERFPSLDNDADRNDFINRVSVHLNRVRRADGVSRVEAVRYFKRAVKDINAETIRLPEELMVSELMRGALEPLDEFTTMIWPEESDEFDKHTRGDFVGIGVQIVKNRVTDEIEVVSPLEDTPAYWAGVQSGDSILAVDGQRIKGMSINKVVDVITGPIHSEVVLTIRRGEKEFELPLQRDTIVIHSVKGTERDEKDNWRHWLDEERGIGYVRIANFQANTLEDLYNLLRDLESQNLNGLVMDLRGNPGGLLDSAWGVSTLFLKQGDTVVSTKGRRADENQVFVTPEDGPFVGLPLVVLVDEGSASASEIVAGAVRDNDRGVVVGARTFGKFSVQNLIKLGRTNAKLKLTTAKYYLPSGVSLHRDPDSETWGVDPNIPIRLVQLEKINLRMKRRAAEQIGPQVGDTDKTKADDADGDKAVDAAKASEPAKADKPAGDDAKTTSDVADSSQAEAGKADEPVVSRFEQPFQLSWGRIEVDGNAPGPQQTTEADAASDQGSSNSDATEKDPREDEYQGPPARFLLDGKEEIKYVAKDAAGRDVTVYDIKLLPRDIHIKAMDEDGKPVEVASLTIAGHAADKITLPEIEQPDENNRPDRDPQLDAALLLMRMTLLEQDHPALAAVDKETQAPRDRK